jgi:NAD(P)-dependent dehydrogenase (short-subunit alcohol dehydrogenase family)
LLSDPCGTTSKIRLDDSEIERRLGVFSNRIRASLTFMSSSVLFDLTDKVAIVTGSTKGIGRAIAEAFVNHGAHVAISGRDAENCEEVASQINGAGQGDQSRGKAIGIACDIRDPASQTRLVETATEQLGPVDILVANAAVNFYAGSLLGTKAEDMAKTFAGNLTSVMQLCQLVIPAMQRSKGGSIILVSSVGGLQGNSLLGPYAISKAGVIQLTRNIAVEFGGDGIRANAIVPGLVKTDFAGPLWQNPELAQARIDKTPLGRLGEPEDLAGAAVYLASRAGAWTTAQTIVVDGGAVMVGR